MNLGNIRSGIATRLQTITGLRVHTTVPDDIQPPAAVIGPPTGVYADAVGPSTSATVQIPVWVLVSRADARTGQNALDDYIDDTGSKSVLAAVDGDNTLGSEVDDCQVQGWENYGAAFTFGDTQYIGVQFNLEVFT